MADRAKIQAEILNLQQDRSAMQHFREQINEAITKLMNAKQYINNATKELRNSYTGKIAKEKASKLESEAQEIDSIVKELRQRVTELNKTINSLNEEIDAKESEL